MGLRENAEAARLADDARKAEERRQKECEREQREQARRAGMLDLAWSEGERIGISFAMDDDGLPRHVWVEEQVAQGYAPNLYLHLSSDDGVWLRYSVYKEPLSTNYHHRWLVTRKCARCEKWITAPGFAETLVGIGRQLDSEENWVANHMRNKHGDV